MQVQVDDGPPIEGMTMTPGALHGPCEPQLGTAIHALLSLRARQGAAIQSGSWRGMPGRCGGLPYASARLPRRPFGPPRNDKVGREWARWDGSAGLPRRGFAPPRNDNGESGGRGSARPGFRAYRSTLSLRARQGVAIQSGSWRGMPGRCGGLPDGSAGLPRRCSPRNDVKSEIAWLQARALGNTGKHARTNFITIMKGKHKIGPSYALHYLMRSAPFSLDLPSDT